jgi:hypothetical protein
MRAPQISGVFSLIVIIIMAYAAIGIAVFIAIAGVVTFVGYLIKAHHEKKRQFKDQVNSLKCKIEDSETQYYNLLEQAAKSSDERIFLLSYAEKLFIRAQIDKDKLALLDDSYNIEKLDHAQLQMHIDELQDDLSKYRKIDTYKMNGQMAKCYKDLTDVLQEINKSSIYIGEKQYKFTTNVFNSVFPDNIHVYSLITKTESIYFYPQYIVLANSETDFTIIRWDSVSVSTRTENRHSSNYLTNGEIVDSRYCYTCKDGSPDLRYKYNPIYYTYRYGIVKIRKFEIAIPNSKLAIRLNDIILRIKSIHNE